MHNNVSKVISLLLCKFACQFEAVEVLCFCSVPKSCKTKDEGGHASAHFIFKAAVHSYGSGSFVSDAVFTE